jgi:hypothetical protein
MLNCPGVKPKPSIPAAGSSPSEKVSANSRVREMTRSGIGVIGSVTVLAQSDFSAPCVTFESL